MYKLVKLKYSFDELEPFIDTHTLGLHYYKHAQNYLNKLNELLLKENYDYRYSLEELVNHIDEFPLDIQNDLLFNLGGVINHNLYFNSISPRDKETKLPTGFLLASIKKTFGSFNSFKDEFKKKATALKGSGYTFLVLSKNELKILNTSNQNTPLYNGDIPLFNIDLWEHAYYLNYENRRNDYIDNFFLIADFSNASEIFETYM